MTDIIDTSAITTNDIDETLSKHDRDVLAHGKIALICIIGFITFSSSCLPWILHKRFRGALQFLGIGCCFAAGVIIGAAFSHLTPDANEAWETYFASANPDYSHADYPFGPLIAAATLIFLIAIDNLFIQGGISGDQHNHVLMQLPADYGDMDCDSHDCDTISMEAGQAEVAVTNKVDEAKEKEKLLARKARRSQAWIFFLALSFHSIFDGLGLGAESEVKGFYGLLVAVLAHKLLDGFALGVPIYFAQLSRGQTLFALLFCASMTPLGIGIGWAATKGYNGASGQLATGIILSISTGTFYFIALIELLPAALHQPGWKKTKILALLLGWGLMALIALWV